MLRKNNSSFAVKVTERSNQSFLLSTDESRFSDICTIIELKELKVSEYSLKQNKKMLKNKTVLLYTYFYNISLNVVRPAFVNIYNLPFLRFPNIGKIGVKVGPKTSYFSSFMSSCTNRIAVFDTIFP